MNYNNYYDSVHVATCAQKLQLSCSNYVILSCGNNCDTHIPHTKWSLHCYSQCGYWKKVQCDND